MASASSAFFKSSQRTFIPSQGPPGPVSSDTASIGDMLDSHVNTHRQTPGNMSTDTEILSFMSIMWHGGKLSCVYYDTETMQIHMMLDAVETDEFQLLLLAVKQIEPDNIVLSCKQDERLLKFLKTTVLEFLTGEPEGEEPSEVIQFLPSLDFSLDICKRRLLSLDLPSIPKHFLDSEKTLYLSSLVPFENTCMVRATGGLLKFLEKMRVGVELEDADVRVPVLDLKVYSLDDQLILDDASYSALQIFQREAHPSVYKVGQYSSTKEGLSLFGILNRCRSPIGSRKLRLWFLRPLQDVSVLQQRLEAVSYFISPRNVELVTSLQDCLKNVKNVTKILSRMTEAQATIGDWQSLYKTAYHGIYIGDLCRAQPGGIEIFKKIGDSFTDDLHRIATLISKIVDFEESISQNRFVVKPNVDSKLDEKKRTYNGLPDFMTKVAREELNRLNNDISECNVIYLPQLGYLLAINMTEKMQAENDFTMAGLTFAFHSNNVVHYKSASTRELDTILGDTQCEITDHEISIMHRLQNTILEHSKVLLNVMDYAAELDCLLAFAACAREFSYVRPELTSADVIEIKGGRHPLQEMCCSPYVANDTFSGGEYSKMKVLTGPNASGKSVYLKQVALIIYMAHIGSFVPAISAVVGRIDRIFTRIRSMESVSVGLSTFMIDVNQMSDALRNATERSLVVVDEFGKGTESVDGISLLCASLKHWLSRGSRCPHTLISTHFHSIHQQELLPQSIQLSYQTMETLHNGEDLVFLYQLIDGHTNSSFAGHVASEAGLPQEIIRRGAEVSELLRQDKPVHRLDTADTETQYNRCKVIVSRFLELDLEKDNLQSFLKDFVLPLSKGDLL